jgi:hypothetical protein
MPGAALPSAGERVSSRFGTIPVKPRLSAGLLTSPIPRSRHLSGFRRNFDEKRRFEAGGIQQSSALPDLARKLLHLYGVTVNEVIQC